MGTCKVSLSLSVYAMAHHIVTFTGCDDTALYLAINVRARMVPRGQAPGAEGRKGQEVGRADRFQDRDLHRVRRPSLEPLRGLSAGSQDRKRKTDAAIPDEPPRKFLSSFDLKLTY